ncbi:amidohydrolase family protein [Bacillus aerolatus]|uniref:Amidohydrolase family protein n=1 Tax=Bacillus aerolatus TaxID=2653354 RepID=A0A6I1FJP1_9BACI|nr:amidohydrolase family protein [Bacillus aerolatus]KAB7706151.1 amidohydrolase family protein [Bacillus aerolatus]
MNKVYLIRGKKLVTVSDHGTIYNGGLVISNGKIQDIGDWEQLKNRYCTIKVIDCSDYVITPSLVDCHTHLLEFAPSSLYPVSPATHLWAGRAILFHALSSGITALGEQICGHPYCDFSIEDYRKAAARLPMDISFAATSISIGFNNLAHFTAVTQSQPIEKNSLSDPLLVRKIAEKSDFPGENIFINATPANFTAEDVPRAGEIMYNLQELKQVADLYHKLNKKIGAHVAGEKGIEWALEAGVDVLHHAHGITDEQIEKAAKQQVKIVATPMGGTHLPPNSPEEIVKLVKKNIVVSIATDAYLPPYPGVSWLPFQTNSLQGPDVLMLIAQPAMQLLQKHQFNENEILALLTANPAAILGKEKQFGRLEKGMDANFIISTGIPGLEINDTDQIKKVFFRGEEVINRLDH